MLGPQQAKEAFGSRLRELRQAAALDITRPVEIAVYVTVFGQMQRTALFGVDARALILQARDAFLQ
jgi:hypothetical protein